ncbi:tRNA-splicing endonuclease subunit [Linderina macrospora]|uniref:tRNA-splicing endonuclease subunit n=1 Tax=Linderina macrospora TaxID=4868 RepID=A0ACC1JDS5_9FUNG|nr:tRNA-splicing endonuclease subunit [Linderina macrospora]
MSSLQPPFEIECSKGNVLVSDADTAMALRRDHRIVGALIGSHPTNPLQNIYLSLPLQLLPEEAATLQQTSIITITGDPFAWPQSDRDILRLKLYQHFRGLGYFVTRAMKFGGDFLLYPGEPMRYHSPFVATLVGYEEKIRPKELVALGRLGTNVRKTRLLCAWDADREAFTVISMNWSAMG